MSEEAEDPNGGEWYQDGQYVRNHRRQVALTHCQDEQIAEMIVAARAEAARKDAALQNLIETGESIEREWEDGSITSDHMAFLLNCLIRETYVARAALAVGTAARGAEEGSGG